jgi:hypothetical protein
MVVAITLPIPHRPAAQIARAVVNAGPICDT